MQPAINIHEIFDEICLKIDINPEFKIIADAKKTN